MAKMMASSNLNALAKALGGRVERDALLSPYTAMRVGGPADLLLVCESVDEVIDAVALAREHGVDWLLLGGGCNVLVADAGQSRAEHTSALTGQVRPPR